MIKVLTLDTNNDLINESDNLHLEVINNETNSTTNEYPTFREIIDNTNPTGIYLTEVDLEVGNYLVIIKHTSGKEASVHFIITEDSHEDLEDGNDLVLLQR